jgi:hypothetical protein
MDQDWGQARALELLGNWSRWLEDEAREHRWHTLLARRLAGLAVIAGDTAGRTTAERILGTAPDTAFSEGAIANFDLALLVRRELPTHDDLQDWFPPYEPTVHEHVRRFQDPHILLALEGRLDEAWAAATSDLDKEECLEMYALLGQFDRALHILAGDALGANRLHVPLMVIGIESYRRGNLQTSRDTLERLRVLRPLDCWMWTQLASGFLGRVPWDGYPFPDY